MPDMRALKTMARQSDRRQTPCFSWGKALCGCYIIPKIFMFRNFTEPTEIFSPASLSARRCNNAQPFKIVAKEPGVGSQQCIGLLDGMGAD